MAQVVMMKNPKTGIIKKGFYGFSWTTFFFSFFPALFRGDLKVAVLVLILSCVTGGIAGIIWAFIYNKRYTLKLIEHGYEFCDTPEKNMAAMAALGVAETTPPTPTSAQ